VLATGTTDADVLGGGNVLLWCGRVPDPFYIDPTVLHAASTALSTGTRADLSGWAPDHAEDIFHGTDVYSIVLEVPDEYLGSMLAHNRSIGIWGVSRLATDAGGWRQINRSGRPMIQPIFNPDGNDTASVFNTTQPSDDRRLYAERFADLVAGVVAAYGTAEDPQAYGIGVVSMMLPDVLRYEVGTVASYGFAGWNGRTLGDNAPEIMYSLATCQTRRPRRRRSGNAERRSPRAPIGPLAAAKPGAMAPGGPSQ
jgi:hypothetical protein